MNNSFAAYHLHSAKLKLHVYQHTFAELCILKLNTDKAIQFFPTNWSSKGSAVYVYRFSFYICLKM